MTGRPLIASPPWTVEEDHLLQGLATSGETLANIIKHPKRSESAVRKRATKLSVPLPRIDRRRSTRPKG